jgi:hypothetical protein
MRCFGGGMMTRHMKEPFKVSICERINIRRAGQVPRSTTTPERPILIGTFVVLVMSGWTAWGAPSDEYQALLTEGKAALQSGDNETAIKRGHAAVNINASRWEAHVLLAGALINLRRCKEALGEIDIAAETVPEDKKAAVGQLGVNCQASAEYTTNPATDASVSQAEIVLWKSIENSTRPGDFGAYLQQYPSGAFAVLAKQHLSDLSANAERIAIQQQQAAHDAARTRQLEGLAWLDASTQLMWAKPYYYTDKSTRWTYAHAETICASLRVGQFTDWRLPTAPELEQINPHTTLYTLHPPVFPSGIGLTNGRNLGLWTSTAGKDVGEHVVIYYGDRYNNRDTKTSVSGFPDMTPNNTKGYDTWALCVRART